MPGDWKRLLRGGFAFGTAEFAVHPLDEQRARKACVLARHERVPLTDVRSHAWEYLTGEGCAAEYVDEQTKRVENYWKSVFQRRKKSAWVIIWGPGYRAGEVMSDAIIAIFDRRKSDDGVRQFMREYYVAERATLEEKVHFASHKKDVPYEVSVDKTDQVHTFGDDPFIVAFVAKNLVVDGDRLRFDRPVAAED